MSKVVAIMSMSLDGCIADLNDGVAEVFDWYFTSGNVEFHTGGSDPMTFKVSGPSAEDLRGLWSELGAVSFLSMRRPRARAPTWDLLSQLRKSSRSAAGPRVARSTVA